MILFGTNHILDFIRGLRRGIREFERASKNIGNGIDQAGFDAGKSLGGIHGKAAFEALTEDNQTVELYDPGVSRNNGPSDQKKIKRALVRKILIVVGGFAFGVLIYCLFKFSVTKAGM